MKKILAILTIILSLNCYIHASEYINIGDYIGWSKDRIDTIATQIYQLQILDSQKVNSLNGESTNQILYGPRLTNSIVHSTTAYIDDLFIKTNSNIVAIQPTIPSVYKFIEYSSNIVTVKQDNVIYKISFYSPNIISNDLSNLIFDGVREAKWELWINYLTTNSLSTQWDSRMDFGGYTPDLTVTGQYKFVCSTVDGINIQAKQVYPTVYSQESMIPSTGLLWGQGGIISYGYNAGTTNFLYFMIPTRTRYIYICGIGHVTRRCTISYAYTSDNGGGTFTGWTQQSSWSKLLDNGFENIPAKRVLDQTEKYNPGWESLYFCMRIISDEPVNTVTVRLFSSMLRFRPANELEIKAHIAGQVIF